MQKIEVFEKLGKGSGTIKMKKNASLTSENKKNDNCQKCEHNPPPPSTIYMQKIEKFKIFQITRNGVKHSKILLKASQSSIMRAKGPSKYFLRTCKIPKTNKNRKRNFQHGVLQQDFDRGTQLKPNY